MSKEAILIIGYPASGKTSVAEPFEKEGYVRLNRDSEGGSVADLLPKMKTTLSKQSVVLDNTFSTAAARKPFIEAAHSVGAKVICVHLTTSIEDAQVNACLRMMQRYAHILSPEEIKRRSGKDPNMFPPAVLFRYRKEFQIPSKAEGFDDIRSLPFKRAWNSAWKGKAIFVDYDGTLRVTKSGSKWPTDPADVKILPGRAKTLARYKEDGYLIFGVSNQSGISDNNPTEDIARKCFEATNKQLGISIPYSFCPHHAAPISCYCRKPMPGLGIDFVFRHDLNPAQCIMVGDQTTDETFAKRCGFAYESAESFFK